MAERHRLRHLQVREAGHDRVGVPLREIDERAAQRRRAARRARRSRRAATAACRWRPGRCASAPVCRRLPASPTSVRQPPLDVEVDVLVVERPRERAGVRSRRAICARPRSMSARSCAARMPARREHARVRERAVDVGIGEPAVEADRGGVALDEVGDRLGEAAGPAAGGGRRRRRQASGRTSTCWSVAPIGHRACRQRAARQRCSGERRTGRRRDGHDACMPPPIMRSIIRQNGTSPGAARLPQPGHDPAHPGRRERRAPCCTRWRARPSPDGAVRRIGSRRDGVRRALPVRRARRAVARLAAPRAAAVRHRRRRRAARDGRRRHRAFSRCIAGSQPLPSGDAAAAGSLWALVAVPALCSSISSCAPARCRRRSPRRGCRRCRRASARISCSTASTPCCRSCARSPQRAEIALQDMADLFRVLMRDNRELAPLADEVELCRQYLELEQLRLGERLHGRLEPEEHARRCAGAAARAAAAARERRLPRHRAVEHAGHGVGQRVPDPRRSARDPQEPVSAPTAAAITPATRWRSANVRERLALHFDAEASLESRVTKDGYEVHIRMPYRTADPDAVPRTAAAAAASASRARRNGSARAAASRDAWARHPAHGGAHG